MRAVAWDIDGTLIDSEPLHESALLEVCAGYGMDVADLDVGQFRGVHMPDVWRALRPQLPAGLAEAEWNRAIVDCYLGRASELRPLPGARSVMEALARAGLRQACVSNSGRAVVDANIGALGIVDLIDFSISLDDVSMGKPDPEPYAMAARRFGLPPDAIVAVEDSHAGAASARAAGLRVVAVSPEGPSPPPPADKVIRRLDELLKLILPEAALAPARERKVDGL